jgi:hypothetical protein
VWQTPLALLTAAAICAGCGHGSDATPPPGDGAIATVDSAPEARDSSDWSLDTGGFTVDDATITYPTSCEPSTKADGESQQSWCDSPANPAGCPIAPPTPDALCVPSGLRCAYFDTPDSFALYTCGSTWTSGGHGCRESCDDASEATRSITATCGSAAPIACGGSGTDLERVRPIIAEIAACCGLGAGKKISANFAGGCVSSLLVTGGAPAEAQWDCLVHSFAGRTLDCATGLACASVFWELP